MFSAEFSLAEEQRFGKQKNLESFLAKEEQEEERWVGKNCKGCKCFSKVVQEIIKKKIIECKSRSCFYRLFMSDQENHWKSYNLEKNMSRVTSLDLLFKTCH